MIDLGITFPHEAEPGVDVVLPDLKFIEGEHLSQMDSAENFRILRDVQYTAETLTHELTHVFDAISQGGVYSTQPEMELRVSDTGVTPVGSVARELVLPTDRVLVSSTGIIGRQHRKVATIATEPVTENIFKPFGVPNV